ncbi:TolC family protein [Candidatus Margulisiibacteriota bacterium]
MKRAIILLLISLLMMSSASFGAEILSMSDFISTCVKTNPRYQITVKDYLIALQTDKSARSLEDWNLIASGIYSDGSPPVGASPLSTYSNVLGYSIGLEKYIANTGTAIQLTHNNSKIRSDFPSIPGFSIPPSPYYASDLSLTITQPLLKNAFGLVTKKSLEISDQSLKLAEIKLREDWEDFIVSLKEDYRKWQKCYLKVKIYEDKYNAVQKQLDLVERQVKVDLSEELDLVQTNQQVKAYGIMLEQAKMDCEAQAKRVSALMSRNDEGSAKFEPEKFKTEGNVPAEKDALVYLQSDSNVKKTADLMVVMSKATLDMKESEELPAMDLMLQAMPNTAQSTLGKSIGEIGSNQYYVISLNASRPLGNDMASAEKKKAEEEYAKASKEKDDIMLNSRSGLAGLYTSLKYLDRMIVLGRENLDLAKKRTELEQNKYNQGRSSVFFLLQAEDSLLIAEQSLNEALFAREATVSQIKSFTDKYAVEYRDLLEGGVK